MGSSSPIFFYNIDLEFTLRDKEHIVNWLNDIATNEGFFVGRLAYHFCKDEYLLDINKKHLKHDYYTDVITFDSSRPPLISGDILISLERVKDNASEFDIEWMTELYRVMAHGLLHLLGYSDSTEAEKAIMRRKEGQALKMLH
ncbi:MAG: rRNA maturation RNase YbeY [Flavobacteriales bacterium]|nr:rRNA maturation RNase YbeY [Flavobacteriales bacterium]NNK80125.1 rRNA maturation RNase YbeY [Flavobacteriales bacterium]